MISLTQPTDEDDFGCILASHASVIQAHDADQLGEDLAVLAFVTITPGQPVVHGLKEQFQPVLHTHRPVQVQVDKGRRQCHSGHERSHLELGTQHVSFVNKEKQRCKNSSTDGNNRL